MNLQLSGDVSDESAQAIGRMLGAQSIISGNLTNMGTFYRFRVRVINVETAAIQTQVSLDLRNDEQVAFLLGGSQANLPLATTGGTTSIGNLIEGTIVPGGNLTEKLAWLQRSADSHNTYIVVVNANENITPHVFQYEGAINITIVLRGDNVNRTVRLRSNGTMFTINPSVTLILDNNITLQGHNQNTGSIIEVNGGIFIMNTGTTITENKGGRGVNVQSGTFTMNGGIISNNGGGVNNGDNFTMNGGIISYNTASNGGGVYIGRRSTFTMNNGKISDNTTTNGGGGVYVGGTFIMRGGTITSNVAEKYGGGVNVVDGLLGGIFTKTGGIITGYNSDPDNGNVVKDYSGTIARRGHAVWVGENKRKEKNAGAHINLSNNNNENWDQ